MKILSIFFMLSSLHAGVADHLRKITDKTSNHSMRNIDFIYMINLDQRPEKWALSSQRLGAYGIFPYRFSAVNGWELSLETVNDVGLKYEKSMTQGILGTSYLDPSFEPVHGVISNPGQVYFCHCMARGPIGTVLSHLSILRDALDSGYQTVWAMEDDIEIHRDPRILSDLIEKLDNLVGKGNWDILFTDRNTRNNEGKEIPVFGFAKRPNFQPTSIGQYNLRQEINEDFIQIGGRFGAYSMIVRRSGMQKIYDFIIKHSIFLPFDMEFHLPSGIKLYTVAKNVVAHRLDAPSDNGGPNYLSNAKD